MIRVQEEYILKLPENIKNTITWYTGGEYYEFNKMLRDDKQIGEYSEHLKNLIIAFQGVPPLTEPMTVYKGKKSENIYKVDKAFSSTSLSIKGTIDFRGEKCCIMQITIPPGSKILPLSFLSDASYEDEILLDRNGTYIQTGTDIRIVDEKEIKFFYISYIPYFSQIIGKDLNKVKDPERQDLNLIRERIIEYLKNAKEQDEDFFDLDHELEHISKKLKINISKEMREIILLRLN